MCLQGSANEKADRQTDGLLDGWQNTNLWAYNCVVSVLTFLLVNSCTKLTCFDLHNKGWCVHFIWSKGLWSNQNFSSIQLNADANEASLYIKKTIITIFSKIAACPNNFNILFDTSDKEYYKQS